MAEKQRKEYLPTKELWSGSLVAMECEWKYNYAFKGWNVEVPIEVRKKDGVPMYYTKIFWDTALFVQPHRYKTLTRDYE